MMGTDTYELSGRVNNSDLMERLTDRVICMNGLRSCFIWHYVQDNPRRFGGVDDAQVKTLDSDVRMY